jgi:bifunctional DNA-binding transcriptional regulator/antitoxin component of YhaV-PrlF toxin-antitoxin module
MADKIRAESELLADKQGTNGTRARVPAEVRDRFGARLGDKFIFEEGCEQARVRAALKGTYFIVTVERAATLPEASPVEHVEGSAPDAPVESFADVVRKKLQGPTQ